MKNTCLSPRPGQPGASELPPFPEAWAAVLPGSAVKNALSLREQIYGAAPSACRVFPPAPQVFRALDLTPPENLRAVILGQDPYPTFGHANGLCFSVAPDVSPLPPSLRNIFREYAACFDFPPPSCGDLSLWAKRGALLLNAVLTVPEGQPNGHRRKGWQALTDAVLQACLRLPGPTVFLLWGREAQTIFQRAADAVRGQSAATGSNPKNTAEKIGESAVLPEKYALRSSHPSPLGAARPCGDTPAFLGSRPFSRANELLGERAIDWRLP